MKALYILLKMNKFLLTILATIYSTGVSANQPKQWQLGFQDAASQKYERYC